MGRYLIKRLAFALLLVFVVSSATLLLTRLAGDPCDPFMKPEECLRVRHELGLDRPFLEQYVTWLSRAARLDFGNSMLYKRPVGTLLGERAGNTAMLALMALIMATLIGIPLGIYSGTTTGSGRSIVRFVSTLGISIPPLIGSLALVFLAARTGWFPIGGITPAILRPQLLWNIERMTVKGGG